MSNVPTPLDLLNELLALPDATARQGWASRAVATPDIAEALRQAVQDLAQRELPQALEMSAALVEALDHANPGLRGYALWTRAIALRTAADYREALSHFRLAQHCFREQGDEFAAARVVIGEVATLGYLGRYAEAQECGARARVIFERHGAHADAARLDMNLAGLWMRQDLPRRALETYRQARAAFIAADEPVLAAMTDGNLASVHYELDEFREAQRLFERALVVFAAEGLARRVAQVKINLATVWLWRGHYQRADALFEEVRPLLAEQGLVREAAFTDWHQSSIRLALNLLDEALTLAERAASAFASLELTQERGLALVNMALALGRLGFFGQAEQALAEAREVLVAGGHAPLLAWVESHTADLALAQRNAPVALTAAEKAVAGFEHYGIPVRAAQAMILKGDALAVLGRRAEAATAFEGALSVLARAGLPWLRYRAHLGRGRLFAAAGDRLAAVEALRAAANDVEAVHGALGLEEFKVGYFGDKLSVYESMVALCLEDDREETPDALWGQALAYVERAKSRALLDRLAERIGEGDGGAPSERDAETAARVAHLREELNWFYNRLNASESEGGERLVAVGEEMRTTLLARERELQQLSRRRRVLAGDGVARRGGATLFEVGALQQALPADTLLIEFYTLEDEIVAFTLDSASLCVHRAVASARAVRASLQQLEFQLNKFRLGLGYADRHAAVLQQSIGGVLRDLATQLMTPLATRTAAAKRLILVPHGQLHTLPFHALTDAQGPLLARWEMSYAPSASLLLRCLERQPQPGSGALVMGLPDARIPHVRAEVEAVGYCLPEAQVYLGEAATAARLRAEAGQRRVVHLATHGLFRADNPLYSALKMADGWLSLGDIYNLDLPSVELVTLSACETGMGHVAAGDELIGLSRAFFATGTPALVVSLWTVDDRAAATLMERFYAGLRDGLTKAAALRHAQLATREDHPHPYYWAPFILLGQPC